MNLVFVIKTLDSRGGGAERVLTQVTGELAQRGHQITLLTFGAEGEPDFYPVEPAIDRVWLNAGNVQTPTGVGDLVQRVRRIRKVLRRLSPDVAVAFMPSAYIPTALAAFKTGISVVASEHIGFDYFRDRPFEWTALRLTAPLYSRILAISAAIRSGFPDPVSKRMVVIPNPVIPVAVQADLDRKGQKILLNVGRLVEQKDQRTLIEAFAKVASAHRDWKLRIVGQGPLKSELQQVVCAKKLEDRIQFPGIVSDMDREYASAQLLVMSSRYESFGLATAEALSAGIPAIGFADCPGTNEIIQHDINGLLVEGPDRVQALADGLDRLIRSKAQRMRLGKAARSTIERFALPAIVDQWEALLRDVVRPLKS